MRTRLLFALIGALGSLLAALAAEGIFHAGHVGARLDERGVPVLIFNSDMNRRLERAGARSGDIQISLIWNTTDDLDLHCVDPAGGHIFFGHRRSQSGGVLDVDMNVQPTTDQPVENIYWPRGSAPSGQYKVYVQNYRNTGTPYPVPFHGIIRIRNRMERFSGVVTHGRAPHYQRETPKLVAEFDNKGGMSLSWWLRPDFLLTLLVVGLWGLALAWLLCTLLVIGQHLYLGHPTLLDTHDIQAIIRSLIEGLVGGVLGQAVYVWLSNSFPAVPPLHDHILGFALLGGCMGLGLSRWVPNLPRRAETVAGTLGGAFAGLAFVTLSQQVRERDSRLLAASVIGFAIGLMIVFARRLTYSRRKRPQAVPVEAAPPPLLRGGTLEMPTALPGHTPPQPVGTVQISSKKEHD